MKLSCGKIISVVLIKIKSFLRKLNPAEFLDFRVYFMTLLNMSLFNFVQDKFFVGVRNRVTLIYGLSVSIVLISSVVNRAFQYSSGLQEIMVALEQLTINLQFISKAFELLINRKLHLKLIEDIENDIEALQNDPQTQAIVKKGFKKFKLYCTVSLIAYTASLFGMSIYPICYLAVTGNFVLPFNDELPGTDHRELVGWVINYIFGLLISITICFLILGKYQRKNLLLNIDKIF